MLPRCLPTPNSVEACAGGGGWRRGRSAVAGRMGPCAPRAWRGFPDRLIRPGFPDDELTYLLTYDADRGGGWKWVRHDHRVEGWSPEAATQRVVPLLCGSAFDFIPRLNLRADRQEPLPMFRCQGLPGFSEPSAFFTHPLTTESPTTHYCTVQHHVPIDPYAERMLRAVLTRSVTQ